MEYAIFDLDGTLLDYEGASHVAIQRSVDPFGKHFSHSLHASIIGTKNADWSVKVVRELRLEGQLAPEELIAQYHSEIFDLIPSMELMPGAARLLTLLKSLKIPVAIATSSSSHVVPRKLLRHPVFAEVVEVIVAGDDPNVKQGKPAPDIFIEAALRLGCTDFSKCVVFEDSPLGALGAVAAGMLAVGVPDKRFHVSASSFPKEAFIVESLEKFCVEKWVEGIR